MKAATFLRIAPVLTLIHSILHTVGGVLGKPVAGPGEQAASAMKVNHFVMMGSVRSYWDLYTGLGLGITVLLTTEAVVFWLLASRIPTEGTRLRPITLVFALGYMALALNSFRYFFLAPVLHEILIVLCLVLATFKAKAPIEENP